jgi:hypothetical protein
MTRSFHQSSGHVEVGIGSVWWRDPAVAPHPGIPLEDLLDGPRGALHVGRDGFRHGGVVVGGLADSERPVQPACREGGVGVPEPVADTRGIVVEMDFEPRRRGSSGGPNQVHQPTQAVTPVLGAGRPDGGYGDVLVSEGIHIRSIQPLDVTLEAVPGPGREMAAGGSLVQEVEPDFRGAVSQGKSPNLPDQTPVLTKEPGIVVFPERAVPPLGAEGDGEPGEPEAPCLFQERRQVAAIGIPQPPAPGRHYSPMLAGHILHVPQDEPEGLDAGISHGAELLMHGPRHPGLVIGGEDPGARAFTIVKGMMRVVRPHPWMREGQGVDRLVVSCGIERRPVVSKAGKIRPGQDQGRGREGGEQSQPGASPWHGECIPPSSINVTEAVRCNKRAWLGRVP